MSRGIRKPDRRVFDRLLQAQDAGCRALSASTPRLTTRLRVRSCDALEIDEGEKAARIIVDEEVDVALVVGFVACHRAEQIERGGAVCADRVGVFLKLFDRFAPSSCCLLPHRSVLFQSEIFAAEPLRLHPSVTIFGNHKGQQVRIE